MADHDRRNPQLRTHRLGSSIPPGAIESTYAVGSRSRQPSMPARQLTRPVVGKRQSVCAYPRRQTSSCPPPSRRSPAAEGNKLRSLSSVASASCSCGRKPALVQLPILGALKYALTVNVPPPSTASSGLQSSTTSIPRHICTSYSLASQITPSTAPINSCRGSSLTNSATPTEHHALNVKTVFVTRLLVLRRVTGCLYARRSPTNRELSWPTCRELPSAFLAC